MENGVATRFACHVFDIQTTNTREHCVHVFDIHTQTHLVHTHCLHAVTHLSAHLLSFPTQFPSLVFSVSHLMLSPTMPLLLSLPLHDCIPCPDGSFQPDSGRRGSGFLSRLLRIQLPSTLLLATPGSQHGGNRQARRRVLSAFAGAQCVEQSALVLNHMEIRIGASLTQL